MIDRKSQLNLFGKGRRQASEPPGLAAPAEVEEVSATAEPGPSVAPMPSDEVSPPPEPTPVQAPPEPTLVQAPPEPSPVAGPSPEPPPEAGPSPEPPPETGPSPAPSPEAPGPTLASPSGGRPQNGAQFAFPVSDGRRRVDMHFSRRMSDLIRRLQLMERDAKSGLGLTLPQAHAIHALDTAGSLRMQELAATLGLAQSTVTRLVAPLKRVGLLDRRPDRNDGRATRAYLTDEGQRSVDRLEQADRELYGGLLDRIPAIRRAEVVAAIELLHEVVLTVARREE